MFSDFFPAFVFTVNFGCPSLTANIPWTSVKYPEKSNYIRTLLYINKPIQWAPPETPFYIGQMVFITGVNIAFFLFFLFCSKHRLWVLVRTASATICLGHKYGKCHKFSSDKCHSWIHERLHKIAWVGYRNDTCPVICVYILQMKIW